MPIEVASLPGNASITTHRVDTFLTGSRIHLPGSQETSTVVTPWVYERFEKERSWVRTPGYRALVASKSMLPNNPMSYRESEVTDPGFLVVNELGYRENFQEGLVETRITHVAELSRFITKPLSANAGPGHVTVDDLYLKARGRLKNAVWDAPLFFAELGKASTMIIQLAERLVYTLRSLRKGRFDDAYRALFPAAPLHARSRRRFYRLYATQPEKAVSSAWLEWTYGIKPLMMDVESAIMACEDARTVRGTTGTLRCSVKSKTSVTTEDEVWWDYHAVLVRQDDVEVHRRLNLRYKVDQSILQLQRFGITNPVSTLQELVPFSFVVDWFVDLGSYISSWDAALPYSWAGGTIGFKCVQSHSWSGGRSYASSVKSVAGRGSTRAVQITRDELTTLPQVSFLNTQFAPKLNTARMLSAGALVTQVFGPRR